MKRLILTGIIIVVSSMTEATFKEEQLKFTRVRGAYTNVASSVAKSLEKFNLKLGESELFIRALKRENLLEVYARKIDSDFPFQKIITYPFCYLSGVLGPKRKQGDAQVPEGVYYIDRFNPYSNFHLSLGLNYPNQSDKLLGDKEHLGGDIFIHGSCVSIGCIPITNSLIEELYVFCVEAKNAGQHEIPVHIFPGMMNTDPSNQFEGRGNKALSDFWLSLKPVFSAFEKNKQIPTVKVNSKGAYYIVD